MNIKRKFFTILPVGIFSGWLLAFLVVQNSWSMLDSETYRHSALARGKEGETLTSPKDVPAPKPPKNFQPQEQDQDPPVIAPPITDPEMVIPPPVTDLEMVLTPEQIEPTEEETIQKENTQKMAP